jgi:hypothetical protein
MSYHSDGDCPDGDCQGGDADATAVTNRESRR